MSNLVGLDVIWDVLKKRKLDKYVVDVEYAKYPKKYTVTLDDGKKVSFGHQDYEDYLIHRDENRRIKYRARHRHDNLDDLYSPGMWSYWILW